MPRIPFTKIQSWNGLQLTRPKSPLVLISDPFYTLKIGIHTLTRLGYGVTYKRLAVRSPTTAYSLIRLTASKGALLTEHIKHSSGICKSLPRKRGKTYLHVKLLLYRVPKNAINLEPRRYTYQLMAVYLLDPDNQTVDVDTIKTPLPDQ